MDRSVVVVRAGWLPTQQANGIQTIRMCEAFAALGLRVRLYHLPAPRLQSDIRSYYNLKSPIDLRRLPRAVLPWRKHFKLTRWSDLPQFVHAFLWSGMVSQMVRQKSALFYFVREPMIAWWLGQARLPTVLEMHDMPDGSERIILRNAARQSTVKLVLAVTDHLRGDLVCQLDVPFEKTLTLHDGVELNRHDISITKQTARERFGLPANKPLVVYTGMLEPEKGLDILVRAAPRLAESQVVILGYGERFHSQRLEAIAREVNAGNVILMGYRPHADALLLQHAADVLVLPHSMNFRHSAYYTSPLKLFEYMSSGVPVVASALPSVAEIIRHGENGWLVQPDHPAALAEGIRNVIENRALSAAMADKAMRDAQNYTWDRRAARIIQGLSL